MIEITDRTKCCGCTACVSVCPQKCISMEADIEGFLYPKVNVKECISCGKCDKVCPVQKPISAECKKIKTYAIRSKDISNVLESTSGGFFMPLAKWMLKNNGIICAAAYDNDYTVRHIMITPENMGDVTYSRFKGSKYVQSYLGDCYIKIKELLMSGKNVCFIGNPCQVQGLKKYLEKSYSNLITVDLVCRGVPSPKLWKKYLDYQIERNKSSITKVQFRSKRYGYHSGGVMDISFKNGRVYHGSSRIDYMLRAFYKEISSRPIPHPKRNEFFIMLDTVGIEKTIQCFIPVKAKDRLIEVAKRILFKLGLLERIAKNKR